jgi:pimeloyl-ACP methyl ester carboxylesterase
MQPLFEHRLSLAGYETRALELEGDGPPLLLLHGFADSADTWRLVLERLGRIDRRALAVDMPGFGTATPLRDGELVIPQLTEFARAAVAHVAPRGGAVVCGNSLGGVVSILLAQEPELRLRGIAPVAPAGLDMARWVGIIERDPIVRTVLAAPVIPGFALRRAVEEVYKRLAFRHPGRVEPGVSSAFASHFRDRPTAARILGTGRRLLPELRDPFDLDRISCPVLLIWGDQDVLVFQTGAERVIDVVDDARLELIEDCGHCPQLECPDRLTRMLVDFAAPVARAA